MSAQKTNQPSTSQSISTGGQSSQGQQSGRQSFWPAGICSPQFRHYCWIRLVFRRQPVQSAQADATGNESVFAQPGVTRGAVSNPVWVPPIEVAYRDGNLVVSAELPGLDDEDHGDDQRQCHCDCRRTPGRGRRKRRWNPADRAALWAVLPGDSIT